MTAHRGVCDSRVEGGKTSICGNFLPCPVHSFDSGDPADGYCGECGMSRWTSNHMLAYNPDRVTLKHNPYYHKFKVAINPCEICGREKGPDERDCSYCIHGS